MTLNRGYYDHVGHTADALSNDPHPSRFSKYVGGLVAPGAFSFLAWRCWESKKAFLPGRSGSMRLEDNDAVAMGFVWAAVALFLFAHYFLSDSFLYRLTDLAKTVALITFIPALFYIIYNFFRPF